MRSGEVSGISRPSRRLSSATSSSRPASMRVVHQAPPPVAISVTRSPSRTPDFRNSVTATFARFDWKGVRCTSSKTSTNERPVRTSGVVLLESLGLAGVVAAAVGGTWIASKDVMDCGSPSSSIEKSDCLRSVSGLPFLSVTTTSTVTSSTSDGKLGVSPPAGEAAGLGLAWGSCGRLARAAERAAHATSTTREGLYFMALCSRSSPVRVRSAALDLDEDLAVLDLHIVARHLELRVHGALSGGDVVGPGVPGAHDRGARQDALAQRPSPVHAGVAQGVDLPLRVEQGHWLAGHQRLAALPLGQVRERKGLHVVRHGVLPAHPRPSSLAH